MIKHQTKYLDAGEEEFFLSTFNVAEVLNLRQLKVAM